MGSFHLVIATLDKFLMQIKWLCNLDLRVLRNKRIVHRLLKVADFI